jgi:hypothetical protein
VVRLLVFVGLVTALVVAAPSAAAPIRAVLTTTTPTPVVDQPWRWTVTVRSASGKPLRAKVKLQILFAGTVVGCWKNGAMRQCSGVNAGAWIAFRGKRSGVLTWPAQSIGIKLTFQAIVVAGGQTRRLRAPVVVQPAPTPSPTP